jgi:hypothetical protein
MNAEIEIVRLRDAAQFGERDAVSRVPSRRSRAAFRAGKSRACAPAKDVRNICRIAIGVRR